MNLGGGGGNVLQSVLSKTTFGGLRNWGWSGQCLFPFKGHDRESPQKGGETYRRWEGPKTRSLGNGVRKNGIRNRCPYRRCGVDTEIPYRLPFWRKFCCVFPVRVASGVDTEFPYRVRVVDSLGGLIAAILFADTVSNS